MINRWSFVIEGPLVGHKCNAERAHGSAYVAFKKEIRFRANLAGVPQALGKDTVYRLTATIRWRDLARTDSVNVYKAIEDGIWRRDRRCLEGEFRAVEHAGIELAEVTVEAIEPEAGRKE